MWARLRRILVPAAVFGFLIAALASASPVVVRSTVVGGSNLDWAHAIAVDAAGNIYIAGDTQSDNLPVTPGVFQAARASLDSDAFVAKLASDGQTVIWATYLGGTSSESATAVAVDASGAVYVAGYTSSTNFPVANAYDATPNGGLDGFIAKLDALGRTLLYSTYFGGAADDAPRVVRVHGTDLYIAGETSSSDFPTVAALDAQLGGVRDNFLVRFTAAGAPAFSTYIGGSGLESNIAVALAVDADGYAYMVGTTESADFPLRNAMNQTLAGSEAYVMKIAPDGGSLVFSTFLGGSAADEGRAVALDSERNLYIAGSTGSPDFPLLNAPDSTLFSIDAFVAKLSADGTRLQYATFIGGSGNEHAVAIVVDSAGSAYVIGQSASFDFPVVRPIPGARTGADNGFVTRLSPDGTTFVFSSFFGGSHVDFMRGAIDHPAGGILLTGVTSSADFPGLSMAPAGSDAFVSHVIDTTRYFAEGATGAFFDTEIALLNPSTNTTANVTLQFATRTGDQIEHRVAVSPRRRVTIRPREIADLAAAEFATVVDSDIPVVADRLMRWGAAGYGSHAETAMPSPALTWYLAEGATHSGFNLFYLIHNPNTAPATLTVTYLLGVGPPITRTYTMGGTTRYTIWVDQEPGLAAADVSAIIRASIPVIVERAMYLDAGGLMFGAGHDSAGVTAPATQWFLAEGATGPWFDLFVLIANPHAQAATIVATYLLPGGGTVVKNYTVTANSRFTIWVDMEDARLSDTALSTIITSTNGVGVIVERAMWWPGLFTSWHEAHNSPGATTTGTRWAVADGEVNTATETYVLIANTSAMVGSVKVTLLFEDGAAPAERTFSVPANSRFNVAIAAEFPAAAGKRFGALVESQGASPAQIVVERAMYSNAGGVTWAAGANALATKLP